MELTGAEREAAKRLMAAGATGIVEITIDEIQENQARDRQARNLADQEADQDEAVAWDRAETDYCERGTQGCSVLHTRDSDCETW